MKSRVNLPEKKKDGQSTIENSKSSEKIEKSNFSEKIENSQIFWKNWEF